MSTMFAPITDLSKARILVSNDDGVESNGLKLLTEVAHSLSDDVWVVAPATEQSGTGHSLTLTRPLRIRKLGERRFSVDGTPTDCVLLGINEVLKDKTPDLVLSGVNRGANLGEDVTYSGTVAAAMEGTLMGVPSIAFSQVIDTGAQEKHRIAGSFAAAIIRTVTAEGWPSNVLMNVNFPHIPADRVKGIRVGLQGRHKLGSDLSQRLDPRGKPYYWIGSQRIADRGLEHSDLAAIDAGYVSLTPLCVDLTHHATLDRLRGLFSEE